MRQLVLVVGHLVRALGRGPIGLPAYVRRVCLQFPVMQLVSICVPPLWFLNFQYASCADARAAVYHVS